MQKTWTEVFAELKNAWLLNIQKNAIQRIAFLMYSLKTEHKNLYLNSLSQIKTFNYLLLPYRISPRPISDIQLNTLLCLHLWPIYLVVFKGSYSLLWGISHLEGGFTLRCLQRLSLPDLATLPWNWFPTGTPAVRPSRSSRTKDSSSQISCAHAG